MAKKKVDYPKLIYMWREYGDSRDSWLVYHENIDDMSELNGEFVGVYALNNIVKVVSKKETYLEQPEA